MTDSKTAKNPGVLTYAVGWSWLPFSGGSVAVGQNGGGVGVVESAKSSKMVHVATSKSTLLVEQQECLCLSVFTFESSGANQLTCSRHCKCRKLPEKLDT